MINTDIASYETIIDLSSDLLSIPFTAFIFAGTNTLKLFNFPQWFLKIFRLDLVKNIS